MQKNQQGGQSSQGRSDPQSQQSGQQPQQGGPSPRGGSDQQSQSGGGRDQQGGHLKSDPGQAQSRNTQQGGDGASRSNKQR